jgi:hypothetical protein
VILIGLEWDPEYAGIVLIYETEGCGDKWCVDTPGGSIIDGTATSVVVYVDDSRDGFGEPLNVLDISIKKGE